jgi:hypothetical protein
MMKAIKWFLIIFILPLVIYSQDNYCNKNLAYDYLKSKGEVYFKFEVFDKSYINEISKIVSIDNVNNFEVFAYANKDEFDKFLKLNIPFWILPHPGDADFDLRMKSSPEEIMEWDVYPTYDGYVTMMNQFAANYPNLCRIVNAGTTVQGRQILFAVISDNVNTPEPEPKFLYTSTMHGDETTGYVLMLRLIDYLLTQYPSNPKISNLVNNIEIWINPNGNPDGTYWGGNNTVNGARRNNANNYDLNRNYPGVDGVNSAPIQVETQNYMNLSAANIFRLSANFHGGAEVVNYPWDCWSRLAADNNWWVRVSRKYADTVHVYAPAGYMNYLDNGITNGYAWYYVRGCRQDYQIYYRHGRESTIEISDTKLLPPAQLPNLWNYNYRSLLNYMEQVLYGVNGSVKDSVTNLPLKAKISIAGFDADSSEIYSDSLFGKYYRFLIQGNYNITFSAPGYYSKTINNVAVINDSAKSLDVLLVPLTVGIAEENFPVKFKLNQNYPNPFNPVTCIDFSVPKESFVKIVVYDILGREVEVLVNEKMNAGVYKTVWNASETAAGIYFCKFFGEGYTETKKMLLIK